MQILLVSVSYAIGLGFLDIRMLWKKEKTPFCFIIVLAVAFGELFEPLYDEATMLHFYSPGIWSLFSSFDIPQPIWVHSGYVTLTLNPLKLVVRLSIGASRLDQLVQGPARCFDSDVHARTLLNSLLTG